MAKLPKKYIKQAGGINKKAWALFRAANKKRKSPKKKTNTRRKPTRRYQTMRRKKVYRRARGGGGKYKPVIDGVAVGLIEQFAGQYVPVPGAIKLAYGIFRKNQTITTLGAMELGQMLTGGIGSVGSTNGGVR